MPRLTRLGIAALLGLASLVQAVASSPRAFADPPAPSYIIQPEGDQAREEIGRGYFQLALPPGRERALRVVVKNTGSAALVLRAYAVDGIQVDKGGVDYSTAEKPLAGAGTWLRVEPPRLALAPGETQRIIASLRVPEGVAPGQHVGGVAVEDEHVEREGKGSNVLIDLHYRQVIAVVVDAPGPRRPALAVGGVSLIIQDKGSTAVVELRNAGNVLLKGTGTLALGGGQASTDALPFRFDTLLPAGAARVEVPLPAVRVKPGLYDVRVDLEAEGYGRLASWQGTATAEPPRTAEETAPIQDVSLDPLRPIAALTAATESGSVPDLLVGAGALLLVLAALGIGGAALRRAWNHAGGNGQGDPARRRPGRRSDPATPDPEALRERQRFLERLNTFASPPRRDRSGG